MRGRAGEPEKRARERAEREAQQARDLAACRRKAAASIARRAAERAARRVAQEAAAQAERVNPRSTADALADRRAYLRSLAAQLDAPAKDRRGNRGNEKRGRAGSKRNRVLARRRQKWLLHRARAPK